MKSFLEFLSEDHLGYLKGKKKLSESISDFSWSKEAPKFPHTVKGAIDTYHHAVDKKLHSSPSGYVVNHYAPGTFLLSNKTKKVSALVHPAKGSATMVSHDTAMNIHGKNNLNKKPKS